MYSVWIRIEENLPWIELKGAFQTRKDAAKATQRFLNTLPVKIVSIPDKKRQMKAVVAIQR
jgi:hypothetical protein